MSEPSALDAALAAEGAGGRLAALARSIYQQESGSGSNTRTSNAGAVGGMQVMPGTFSSVADPNWDIKNPVDNARAGIRYVKAGLDASGGDSALAAAYYYGGPGGMAKAQRGIGVSDPRNPNAPNTLQYAQQVVNRMPNDQTNEAELIGPMGLPNAASAMAESDRQRGALTQAAAAPAEATAEPMPQGAFTQVAATRPQPIDMAAMLAQYMPQDDSQSKWLALAAGFGSATKTGSFGEQIGNVANALQEQKMNQQKLRSQYVPLIMQQVAAQQARDEQAQYRMEAAQQAQNAARIAQQERITNQNFLAQQAQASTADRAEADRLARKDIADQRSQDRRDLDKSQARIDGKAPSGYGWGPMGADGQPTLIAVKGGPADLKIAGMLNQDTQTLASGIASMDRLSTATNEILNHPGLPGVTGLRGAIPNIPGTDAANAAALLTTLKSQVSFGVLQDMRNNSKTGGALGAVSDKEISFLQSNLAALEKAQSLDQFKTQLGNIIKYTEGAKDRMRGAYNLKHGPDSTNPVRSIDNPDAAGASSALPGTAPASTGWSIKAK